jgi:hypothetical protein
VLPVIYFNAASKQAFSQDETQGQIFLCFRWSLPIIFFAVIKVYGIYRLDELDGGFWDSVSHQLSRLGKEYSFR